MKADLLERGKRVKERPRVTVTRFRDVPFDELNHFPEHQRGRWAELRGTEVKIIANPISREDVADDPHCDGPFWPLVGKEDRFGHRVAYCAHVLEID